MKVSTRGRSVLKSFEGFSEVAYIPVPGDVPTIGYGFTKGVQMGQHMTKAQADARLITELGEYENHVDMCCTLAPNQNQFDALVCLAWNIGKAGFSKSSVLKAHNRGDFQSAARAFALWNKSGGKVYAGLTRRRAAEAALYREPANDSIPHEMPQTVDSETPMAGSSINRAGVIAGTTTAAVTASQTINTLADLGDSVSRVWTWHDALVPILGIVAVVAVVYIIYERFQQRKQGWK